MKTKPILIGLAIIVLIGGIVFFVRSKSKMKTDSSEIAQFLNKFNNSVTEHNSDTLLACFQADKRTKALKRFVYLLAGKNEINSANNPLFNTKFDVDNADVKSIDNDLVEATIPAKFSRDSLSDSKTVLILKIRQVTPHQYKIVQADTRRFLTDYAAYENMVKIKTAPAKDIYSAITLEAFKTADQLKTRYDSVIWFAHLQNKNYFYVVKGKWNIEKDINRQKDSVIDPYKMGLVNPELKEIIPVEYDLVHNISATFDGLVEVEKDNKMGFYNLAGKLVIPVNYDQVYPINDDANLAVLKNGDDYFYLKKDTTISEKVDLKIGDFFSKMRNVASSFDLFKNAMAVITEYNSKDEQEAIYFPPSHLVEMNIAPKWANFKNPLRNVQFDDAHKNYEITYAGNHKTSENWLEASFYSIRDYFLGGRSEFYDKKNIVIVDKKRNRIFSQDIPTVFTPEEEDEDQEALEGKCNVNDIRIINDSLFEVRSGTRLYFELYDSTKAITGGPFYHYLTIKNNKLVELPDNRIFGFTKYIKMDDSYLNGCYNILIGTGAYDSRAKKDLDHITPEMLRYMKNEIYADYKYKFKDKRWAAIFTDENSIDPSDGTPKKDYFKANVDDSLTEVDKYNISWITKKLNEVKAPAKAKPNTLAAR